MTFYDFPVFCMVVNPGHFSLPCVNHSTGKIKTPKQYPYPNFFRECEATAREKGIFVKLDHIGPGSSFVSTLLFSKLYVILANDFKVNARKVLQKINFAKLFYEQEASTIGSIF